MNYDHIGSKLATDTNAAGSFMSSLTYAHSSIAELTERAESLANRLCGSVPQNAGADTKLSAVPTAGGVFDEIAARGRDLTGKADRLQVALSRIESALP